MRRNLTPAEEALWDAIKRVYFDGVRFRRQHPVGTWILDFYCPKLKLVIEVDGKIHDSKTEYDAIRTAHLESHGYHVVRFQNEEIFGDLPGVMIKIQIAVEQLAQK